MEITIHQELDLRVETIGLLYFSHCPHLYREQVVALLNQMGIDGEAFYVRHAKAYDKYVRTFSKHKRVDPKQGRLFEDEPSLLGWVTLPFLVEREENFELSALTAPQLRTMLVRGYNEMNEDLASPEEVRTTDDFVQLVDQTNLTPQSKWRLTSIFHNPCPYFQQLDGLVNANLGACRQAIEAVRPALDKLIARYNCGPEQFVERYVIKGAGGVSDVYPLFVMPFSQLLAGGTGYYGLLWDDVMEHSKQRGSSLELLCGQLKAMGDKSKLDILLLLRQQSSYNQEIAAKLKLTPATVSYHMETLTSCGLVELERKEKRIYYTLRRDKLRGALDELRNLF